MSNSTEQQNIVGFSNRLKDTVTSSHKKVTGAIKKSTATLSQYLIRAYEDEKSPLRLIWWKVIPAIVSFCIVFAVVAVWMPVTFAYEVKVDGKTVGYVSNEDTFQAACDSVNQRLVEDTLSVNPYYFERIVVSGDVDNIPSIYENLITTHNFGEACGLYVNGELALVAPNRAEFVEAVDIAIQAYYGYSNQDAICSDDLKFVEGLFDISSSKYMETPDIARISSVITVCTASVETVVEEVPFETVKISDSSKPQGYEYTSVSGITGKNKVTYKVFYQNGVEIKREVIKSDVVSAPRDKKVVVGTKPFTAGPNGTNGGNAKFFWPVARVANSYVSAYWGDGRGHTAVDICAPLGTPIYAGEAGTVVEVNIHSGGYGQYFIIDHGNGYQTLYSHCSAMFVKVGQKVTRGQNVAAVGETGRATGTHLHFEVRVGGVKVDPAPYLGLYK